MSVGQRRIYVPEPTQRRWRPSERRRHKRKLLLSQCPRCFYCQAPLDETTATLDHFKPLSKGGSDLGLDNLVLACKPCNVAKGNHE